MQVKQRIYIMIAKLFPRKYRNHLAEQIVYSGEKIDVDSYLGSATLFALLIASIALLVPYSLAIRIGIQYAALAISLFVLAEFFFYLLIRFKVEDRAKRVEEVLPDFLQLVASNVRAGMTPFQALKVSARKEFGPLEEEIRRAVALSLGTESFSDALMRMSERIKSETLERSIKLFTTSMRSGGHLANLLEELAKEIAETRSLKRDLVTSTKTYTAFIMFTVVIGAPLLLAISIQFIKIMNAMQSKVGVTTTDFGLGFMSGSLQITPVFLTWFSIVLLIITSLLASMLLGVIAEGKIEHGLRFGPAIMAGSLAVFAVCRYLINSFMGGMV